MCVRLYTCNLVLHTSFAVCRGITSQVDSTQILSNTLFRIVYFISYPARESGLRVAGAPEWGIFLHGQGAMVKEHQLRKNMRKLDDSEQI